MSITAAIRDRLKAQSVAGGRVYRDERPEGTALPAAVIYLVSSPAVSTLDGRRDYQRSRIQIDCFAAGRGAADDLADAVVAAVEATFEAAGVRVDRSFIANRRGDSDRRKEVSGEPGGTTYRTMLDLSVWHSPI
ncbi:DUF3168 domain-containing protein [Sphingomonas sp. 1P06PA]|uniref:tail completion protein gp17 n=1 Tax=Sphingomonas sp. 1P06PA TaxID=554121 RepID=UPI0039A630FB